MSGAAPTRVRLRRGLTLGPLIAATFFMVSGGPYGLEDIVAKAGYGQALLLLAITPLVWSLPVAMMVGELSAALPEDGGYYVWVRRALGPFWGFQEAWLSLAASIFDMAIYPTIFVLYLGHLAPALTADWRGVAVGAAMIAACAAWNIAGARAVGKGSVALMLALLAPFAVLIILGVAHAGAAPPPPAARLDLLGGILITLWNYMGWDNASTVAREVENPQRTYPRAMLGAVALVALCYLAPVAAAARAGLDVSAWTTGAWVEAGRALGGGALALAIVAGGMLCGLGMTNALVLSYTRVPLAMAEDGFLPRGLAKLHPRSGAPWVSIVVCSLAWIACLPLGFEKLVEIDILLYGGSLLLEFVALVALRIREPGLPRPFRVPGGTLGAALLAAGPVAVLALAIVRGRTERAGPLNELLLGVLVAGLGVVLYGLAQWRRRARTGG